MTRYINLCGRNLPYELEHKKVKNINLRIKPDGTVHVSAPARVPVYQIESFMQSNAALILKALTKIEEKAERYPMSHSYAEGELFPFLGDWLPLHRTEGKRNFCECDGVSISVTVKDVSDTALIKKTLENFYRRECEKVVSDSCERLYGYFSRFGIAYPEIKYRYMKSKWGSCRPTAGILTFNVCLVYTPVKCIDYVVAHEFTHFLHADHSKAFYSELEKSVPEQKALRKLLNEFSSELPH